MIILYGILIILGVIYALLALLKILSCLGTVAGIIIFKQPHD